MRISILGLLLFPLLAFGDIGYMQIPNGVQNPGLSGFNSAQQGIGQALANVQSNIQNQYEAQQLAQMQNQNEWPIEKGFSCFNTNGSSNVASVCVNLTSVRTYTAKNTVFKTVWYKINFTENGAAVAYRMFINCQSKQVIPIETVIYNNGESHFPIDSDDTSFDTPKNQSDFAVIIQKVCG